jgi:hypothetical protein
MSCILSRISIFPSMKCTVTVWVALEHICYRIQKLKRTRQSLLISFFTSCLFLYLPFFFLWFSIKLIGLFVIPSFLFLFSVTKVYIFLLSCMNTITKKLQHVIDPRYVSGKKNNTAYNRNTLFAINQNHFLSTLFQDIPKTLVHIGSGAYAASK